MNPRRKAQWVELWKNKVTTSPSGAEKHEWVQQDSIRVALYDQSAQNQLTMGASGVRVKQYDYLGITPVKTLVADDYRLKDAENTYRVKGVNNEGRLAQLFLEVIKDGQ